MRCVHGLALVAVLAFAEIGFAGGSPYGVAAHLEKSSESAETTVRLCRKVGIGAIRTNVFSLEKAESIWSGLSSNGLEYVGLLYSYDFKKNGSGSSVVPQSALDEWRDYVRQRAERMRGKITSWEVWNEQNIGGFWRRPNPTNYLAVLKTAHQVLKEVDSSNQVVIGGFAGLNFTYIEELYRLGAKDFFDVMNFHLYADHGPRNVPEQDFDLKIEQLRALMAKYGDRGKPMWMTETGWPTHLDDAATEKRTWVTNVVRRALAVARPGKGMLRVGVVSMEADSGRVDLGTILQARTELSESCDVVGLSPDKVAEALDGSRVDVLWWTMNGEYFDVGEAAVGRFLKRGGTVVLGFRPENAIRRNSQGAWVFSDETNCAERLEKRFRYATGAFRDAGIDWSRLSSVRGEKFNYGYYMYKCGRYLTDDNLDESDSFQPVFEAVDNETGRRYPLAGVYSFGGGQSGTLVVSLVNKRNWWSCSEERQAVRLARNYGLLLAEGVERIFWYEFQDAGESPSNPQHHFGLTSTDYSRLKPACRAYEQLIRMRPVGSVQSAEVWHDEMRTFYCPAWTRPDGRKAGMLWTIGSSTVRDLALAERVSFCDYRGESVDFPKVDGKFFVRVTDEPIYWMEESKKEEVK